LEYKHHQRSFWSLVAALMPDYQEQEKVLKWLRLYDVW
jgi:predicted metal-dependent hydrolase